MNTDFLKISVFICSFLTLHSNDPSVFICVYFKKNAPNLGAVISFSVYIFSHPDFTVGSGISPDRL